MKVLTPFTQLMVFHNFALESKTIVKNVNPKNAILEAALTKAAHLLSQGCDFFYSPRILDCDLRNGILKLERIEGIISLADYLIHSDGKDIIRKVARTLAFVHSRLEIPEELKRSVPQDWSGPDNDFVTLHGDFNLINVCCHVTSGRIVILDWSTGPALNFVATTGPRQLDIAHFIRSLLLQQRQVYRAFRLFYARTDDFLQAYQEELGQAINLHILGDILEKLNLAILYKQWRRKMVVSMTHTIIGHIIFRRLKNKWCKISNC